MPYNTKCSSSYTLLVQQYVSIVVVTQYYSAPVILYEVPQYFQQYSVPQ